jgi:ABC-2 type transport system ATP-binding protein
VNGGRPAAAAGGTDVPDGPPPAAPAPLANAPTDPAGASPAVVVRGLGRSFAGRPAVSGLELTVGRGELFGLVGPDGAGKTTTLRMLAGVLRPSSGEALLGGISVVRDPEAVKRRIAYMPQRFGLYTDLTVAENLAFYADLFRVPRGERPQRLERLYAFSNLGPFRDRLAGQLSGGMKQKLALSCALVHEPEILLLDEPTFGVDPVSRRDLWRIVHEMVGHGVTAVVSTAYLDEAERFDRVALLFAGRLLALDTPRALAARLEGELVGIELPGGRARGLRPRLAAIPGVLAVELFGDRLHVTVERRERVVPALEAALAADGLAESRVRPLVAGLEDVFLAYAARELRPPGGP